MIYTYVLNREEEGYAPPGIPNWGPGLPGAGPLPGTRDFHPIRMGPWNEGWYRECREPGYRDMLPVCAVYPSGSHFPKEERPI